MKNKKTSRFLQIACISPVLMAFAGGALAQTAPQLYADGLARQKIGDYYGAVEKYHEAVAANPDYSDVWYNLAYCTYNLEQYELALDYLDRAEKYAPQTSDLQNLRGFIYISQGKLAEARSIFTAVLKARPNDVDSRFGLAELDLYNGRIAGAEQLYLDALQRSASNRKALLSLALISAENGRTEASERYINLALRYHNNEPQVHYMAAYLASARGNLNEAETRARSAIQINPEYDNAYLLLAQILYMQGRYDAVTDICLYLTGRNRRASAVWYLNGLVQAKQGNMEEAIAIYDAGLKIVPDDEVMRGALELLVLDYLTLEDPRRAAWGQYHSKKAAEAQKRFNSVQARYEYNRALRMNPFDTAARRSYAEMLRKDGLYELYLEQLKFLNQNAGGSSTDTFEAIRAADTIEALESMLTYSLATKWGMNPFYLNKSRWTLGIFCQKSDLQLLHPEAESVTAGMLADVFAEVPDVAATGISEPVDSFSAAYRQARNAGQDYFALVTVEESLRDFTLRAKLYSGRTGVQVAEWTVFRTGNDRYAEVLTRFRRNVLAILPVRGRILSRSGSDVLVDLGRTDGIVNGCIFDVVKSGYVKIEDKGTGVTYEDSALLGKVEITRAGEEISEGVFRQKGFYDRQSSGDEVILVFKPDEAAPGSEAEQAQKTPEKRSVNPADEADMPTVGRIPALIELIRGIR